jgi:hypothetical protein
MEEGDGYERRDCVQRFAVRVEKSGGLLEPIILLAE